MTLLDADHRGDRAFERLFEHGVTPMLLLTLPEGRVVRWNTALRRLLDKVPDADLWVDSAMPAALIDTAMETGHQRNTATELFGQRGPQPVTIAIDLLGEHALVQCQDRRTTPLASLSNSHSSSIDGQKLAAIMATSPLATSLVHHHNHVVVDVNPAFVSMVAGQEQGPRGASTAGAWVDDGERERFLLQLEANGTVRGFPAVLYKSTGGLLHVEIYAQRLDIDGEPYRLIQFTDLTEREESQARLKNALLRLESAQAIAKLGDFELRTTGELVVSTELVRLLGLSSAPPTIEGLVAAVEVDDQPALQDLFTRLASGAGPQEIDTRRGQGICRFVAHRDTSGNIVGTVQDVTLQRQAEDERLAMESKIQETQRLESLGVLAGGVAHDFNNLLAGILGNADLALYEPGLLPPIRDRLQDIVTASQRAADLTRQLLAYSGKGRFVVEPLDLNSMIQEMNQLLHVTMRGGVVVKPTLEENLPAIEADRAQLQQVIMNLIINGSEACENEPQGVVSVTTGSRYCDANYLASSDFTGDMAPGPAVWFEVSDNGVGMDDETIAQMFHPFFTTKFTGRGLGMSAVMGIVHGHGGCLRVYSEVGVGTSIKVLLPAVSGIAPMQDTDAATTPFTGDGTVLVIDDDEEVRQASSAMLRRFGFTVVAVANGLAGLDWFETHADECVAVLLDLTMPGLDGVETFARLRQLDSDVRVVLMSGYNEQDATQRFVGRGLAGFLAKPFLVGDLRDAIQRLQDAPPTAGPPG